MNSEVVAIRQQIERECLAMKAALSGYAVVSAHKIITHRFQAIGEHEKRLTASIGLQEAQRITYETYEQVLDAPDG